MAQKRDYYEVLSVERTATVEVIKRSYRKLAAQHHPDRNPGDDAAVERFKEAAEAFSVLSDQDKRQRYDRYGHAGLGNNAGPQDAGDIFDAFGDLFEGFGFFGAGGGRRGGRAVRRGQSLRTAITIELAEAASGCNRTIELDRRELCDTCDGSGAKPGTAPVACQYCGGAGRVVQSQGFFRVQTTCPACGGEGKMVRDKCPDCGGDGRQRKTVKLDVKVPAGVDTGMQLCVRGEGDPGPGGGPRGDVYVDIQVKPHPFFEREGRNLICEMPVTYTQLCLGSKLEVPLLKGRHTLTIPPGAPSDEAFRVGGQGLPDPQGGGRGDLFVHLRLEVPKRLDERHEEILRQLAEHEHANVSAHRKSFFEKLKDYFSGDDDDDT